MFNLGGKERGVALVRYGIILLALVVVYSLVGLIMQSIQISKNYEITKELVAVELEAEEVMVENLERSYVGTFLSDIYADGKEYKVELNSERNFLLVVKVVDIKNIQEKSHKDADVEDSIEVENELSEKQE